MEPQFKELSLEEVIRQVAKIYTGMEINIHGGVKIVGDERLLRDMFFNLFNNSSENPKGMGLGLAIVKHIAELHGWR